MNTVSRGINPDLLYSQVKNTMPYLFDKGAEATPLGQMFPAEVLRGYEKVDRPLNHFEYFRLCLCSHFLTCGTPVPTDVDNQIRLKLWSSQLSLKLVLEMAQLVLDSRDWDFRLLSSRFVYGAVGSLWQGETLSGHLGEWFTVSAGAYCALAHHQDASVAREMRGRLLDKISDEVNRHSEIFGSLWNAREGLGCLKACACISHNFGDLDRVMDMWNLSPGDPLRLRYYKLTASPFDSDHKLRYLGRIWVAGELYKSMIATRVGGGSMSFENHRYFALRKPRCLRRHPDFRIPIGPFLDDWGREVALGLAGEEGAYTEQTLEVIHALKEGWKRLPNTVGYGRALHTILKVHPELSDRMTDLVQIRPFRKVLEMSQEQFEKVWSEDALYCMDDIPSRA